MILRVLNLIVIGALILAAAYVYRIKFDATVQAERLAKLRGELRRERDRIAALRAEWGQLDSPGRIEALTKRYLKLRPIAPTQFDALDHLPERPPQYIKADNGDPIGSIIGDLEEPDAVTGTAAAPSESSNSESPPAAAANPAAIPASPDSVRPTASPAGSQ